MSTKFTYFLLVFFALLGAYFLGNFIATRNTKIAVLHNYDTLKKIAELASLEATGKSEIDIKNTELDGSFTSQIQNLFFENSLHVSIPYTAKYGIDLNQSKLKFTETDSAFVLYFPAVKLLSYELNLNHLESNSKTGLLVFEDHEFLKSGEKLLYEKSRKELETNTSHIENSKTQLAKIWTGYFSPFHIKVVLFFDGIEYNPTKLEQ